jgi:putative sterol carrier protein
MPLTPTTPELLAALQETVDANPNNLKSKFNACVEFHIGDDQKILLNICANPKTKPDLVVRVSLHDFHQMLNKKLTPQQAFMKGKLKVKGNMGLALKMTLVLNATRKVLKAKTAPRSKL